MRCPRLPINSRHSPWGPSQHLRLGPGSCPAAAELVEPSRADGAVLPRRAPRAVQDPPTAPRPSPTTPRLTAKGISIEDPNGITIWSTPVWKFFITFTDVLGLCPVTHDEFVQPLHDSGYDGENAVSTLRIGSAALNAAAKMKERGYTNQRSSCHRLTPGTVKFAAFHVLSLEGSNGLTILEVTEKIQKSGLRDLTTSKTPEASIAAALSRDANFLRELLLQHIA